jgi:hypothetical protein
MRDRNSQRGRKNSALPIPHLNGFDLDFCLFKMLDFLFIKIISKVSGYVFSRFNHGSAEVLG